MRQRSRMIVAVVLVTLLGTGSTLLAILPAVAVEPRTAGGTATAAPARDDRALQAEGRAIWGLLLAGDKPGLQARLVEPAQREFWVEGDGGGAGENAAAGLATVRRWVAGPGQTARVTEVGVWPRKAHSTMDVVSLQTDRGRVDLFLRIADGKLVKIWIGADPTVDFD